MGGLHGEPANMANSEDPYLQAVARAKALLRNMESVTQSLYDDGMILFSFAQSVPFEWPRTGRAADTIDRQPLFASMYGSARVLQAEASSVIECLEQLLAVSHEQIVSEGRFKESMAIRISRMSILNGNRRLSQYFGPMPETANDDEDVVDMETAFRKGPARGNVAGLDGLSAGPISGLEPEATVEPVLEVDEDQTTGHKKSFSFNGDQVVEQEPPDDDDFIEKGICRISSLLYKFTNDVLKGRLVPQRSGNFSVKMHLNVISKTPMPTQNRGICAPTTIRMTSFSTLTVVSVLGQCPLS